MSKKYLANILARANFYSGFTGLCQVRSRFKERVVERVEGFGSRCRRRAFRLVMLLCSETPKVVGFWYWLRIDSRWQSLVRDCVLRKTLIALFDDGLWDRIIFRVANWVNRIKVPLPTSCHSASPAKLSDIFPRMTVAKAGDWSATAASRYYNWNLIWTHNELESSRVKYTRIRKR